MLRGNIYLSKTWKTNETESLDARKVKPLEKNTMMGDQGKPYSDKLIDLQVIHPLQTPLHHPLLYPICRKSRFGSPNRTQLATCEQLLADWVVLTIMRFRETNHLFHHHLVMGLCVQAFRFIGLPCLRQVDIASEHNPIVLLNRLFFGCGVSRISELVGTPWRGYEESGSE